MKSDKCCNCDSVHVVGTYAYTDWKLDDTPVIGNLCLDCWIIVYKEGEYAPH